MNGLDDARALWRLTDGHHRRLALGVLALGVQAVALLPIAALVHDTFAHQIPASDGSGVLRAGLAILALYLLSAGLSLVARRLILVALFTSLAGLRSDVLRHLHELPLTWHAEQEVPELYATLVLDGERLETNLPSVVPLLQALVVGLPLAVVAVIVSPMLSLVTLAAAPVLAVLSGRRKQHTAAAIKAWIGDHRAWGAHVMQTLRTMPLIRTRGVDQDELAVARQRVAALQHTGLGKSWSSNVGLVVTSTAAAVVGALVLVAGGMAVAEGALTLSELLAFYAVIALLLRHVTGAAGTIGQLLLASAALSLLHAIVDEPARAPYTGGTELPFDGSVALDGVAFSYGTRTVLDGFDLAVDAGERVALVGPNGVGKSTAARLILGLQRPSQGVALAGGRPLDDHDVAALRRHIGVIPQATVIRPGTVLDNVTFGRPGVHGAELDRVLDASGLTDLAARLPAGLATIVGDDGVLLSGGERQAIAIARALVGAPRLLVLDEPTNHLDGAAVARLLAAIEAHTPRPAVLMITHDPALAAWADRTVDLRPIASVMA